MLDNATNNNNMIHLLLSHTARHFSNKNQGDCAVHVLNLDAQAIFSPSSKVQIDSFDVEIDSDHAIFELPADNHTQMGSRDQDAEEGEDKDEEVLLDLVDDKEYQEMMETTKDDGDYKAVSS